MSHGSKKFHLKEEMVQAHSMSKDWSGMGPQGTGLKLPMILLEEICIKLRGPWTSYDIREQCQQSLQLYSASSKKELRNGLLQSSSFCRCVSYTGHFSS